MQPISKPPITKGTVIRSAVLVAALANQLLLNFGYSPLPVDDAGLEAGITWAFTAGAAAWAWWKDNDIRRKARQAHQNAVRAGLKK